MAVTVTSNKTVSFRSPYAGETFQRLAEKVLGRDGYLGGGLTTDNGSIIGVALFSVVQSGIVADSLEAVVGLPVPTAAEPWFVLASIPDDDPDSGIVVSVTTDLTLAQTGVIVAYKTNGSWQNPRAVDAAAAAQNAAEVGLEAGFAATLGVDGSGFLNQLDVATGRVVDPDASRRDVAPEAGESAKVASALPPTPHEAYVRNDQLVLRQRESFSPALTVLRGSTLTGSSYTPRVTIAASGTATRPSFYGRPGGTLNQQWWAWGDGNDLHILGGPAGGGFADPNPYLTSGAITGCWIAGQRPADDAVILLYMDGTALKVLAFDDAAGTVAEAPVTIGATELPNAIVRPSGVLDSSGRLHLVVEHDDGTEQQIYYAKIETATAVFGTAAIAPRIVAGANTAKNDTWPSIGVDRFGTAHIAYITGTGANEYGDLVYAQINNAGTLVDGAVNTYLVGSAAAEDLGAGFINEVYDDFRKPSIVVTPHDEIYAAVLGSPNGGAGVEDVLLFSPAFRARIGWDLFVVRTAAGGFLACGLTSNDQGGMALVDFAQNGPPVDVVLSAIDTVPAPEGRLAGTVLVSNFLVQETLTLDPHVPVSIGSGGDVVVSLHTGSAGVSERREIFRGATGPVPPTPTEYAVHPQDVVLKTYRVAGSATGVVPVSDGVFASTFEVFNTRPKRLNYPILVGDEGDFQGYDSLDRAIMEANRVGGEVVLRAGRHVLRASVQISSSMSICGDGMAYLDAVTEGTGKALLIGKSTTWTPTITANKVVFPALAIGVIHPRAGDFVELTGGGGTGFHRIAQVTDLGTTGITVIVDDAYGATTGTPPAGTAIAHYPTGFRIENLCINAGVVATGAADIIRVERSFQMVLRNLAFVGSHTNVGGTPGAPIAFGTKSIMPLIEQIDFTQFNAPTGHYAINFGEPSGFVESPMTRHCRLRDGGPKIMVGNGCTYPQFEFIHADGSDPTATIIDVEIDGGRATPIYVVNVEGRIAGDEDDLAVIQTNVGRRVRVPEIYDTTDDSGLELEDGNTRASTIVDKAIKLTSSTHKEFDGVSKEVITDAVNERLLRAGDTMSGTLTMDANLIMAANLVADTADTREIGTGARMELVNAHRLEASNIGGASADTLIHQATAHDQQTGFFARLRGARDIPTWLANPLGPSQFPGPRIRDDFNWFEEGSAKNSFWESTTYTGGTGTGFAQDNRLALAAPAAINGEVDVQGRESFNVDMLPGFSCAFTFKSLTTSTIDRIGWGASGEVLSLERDTSVDNNFKIRFTDNASNPQTIDTGFGTTTVDQWYYVTVAMISLTEIAYRIGTTPEWKSTDTIAYNAALPGSGTISSFGTWSFHIYKKMFIAVARTTYYEFVELFSQLPNPA
ncbi:MAG: hypothetical protein JRE57_00165 [Deltaproteobacteria bacterium]|nr:hypothetical protein [Deltaproteobacteria bacterium]